jgi:hypothetical protein
LSPCQTVTWAQTRFFLKEAARKFAYKPAFMMFKTVFTDRSGVFRIEKCTVKVTISIFRIGVWHFDFLKKSIRIQTPGCPAAAHGYGSTLHVGPSYLPTSIKYKKFWEELIAYFPLIRHEPHRTRKKNN